MFEQHEAETTNSRPDSLFQLLVESVRDYAIFLLDANGYILTWNEGARRLKGYESGEIIGKHFSTFYEPHEIRRGKPEYELRVAIDEGRWEEEGWRVRKDGTRFWANVVITALRWPDGQLVGFAKVTRDLTERKRSELERDKLLEMERTARTEAERALEQLRTIQKLTEATFAHLTMEDLLPELLDQISDHLQVDTVTILLLDPNDDTLVVRSAKGLEEEAVRGVRIPLGEGFAGRVAAERRSIVIDDISGYEFTSPVLRDRGLRSLLGVPLLIEGRVIGVLHVGSLFYRRFSDVEAQFLQIVGDRVAMAIEHARLIEAERTARFDADVAEAKLRTQEEFLAIAAHELRSPMTTVKGTVQLLLRRHASNSNIDGGQLRPTLEMIEHQTNRLADLVTHLLDSVRIQSGRLAVERTSTNLVLLMTEALEAARGSADGRTLILEAPNEIWAAIDPIRIGQVINNILDNAIKFSEPDAPIEVEVNQPEPDRVRFAIRDHGIGVPPEHRPHLFERFYQANPQDYRPGLGLGLYICREIVNQHGGEIHAEFPEDGGTRFIVTLPVDVTASQSLAIHGDDGSRH